MSMIKFKLNALSVPKFTTLFVGLTICIVSPLLQGAVQLNGSHGYGHYVGPTVLTQVAASTLTIQSERRCRLVQGNVTELCIGQISLYHVDNRLTARLRVDISRAGQAPHNEYMIWNVCGTAEFRLLSREPMHLPAVERLRIVQATGKEEMHVVLRAFGMQACATSV